MPIVSGCSGLGVRNCSADNKKRMCGVAATQGLLVCSIDLFEDLGGWLCNMPIFQLCRGSGHSILAARMAAHLDPQNLDSAGSEGKQCADVLLFTYCTCQRGKTHGLLNESVVKWPSGLSCDFCFRYRHFGKSRERQENQGIGLGGKCPIGFAGS